MREPFVECADRTRIPFSALSVHTLAAIAAGVYRMLPGKSEYDVAGICGAYAARLLRERGL